MSHSLGYRFARIAVGLGAVLFQLTWFAPIVPAPAFYVLWLAWAIELVIVIWLAIRHTWFAPIVPVVSSVVVMLLLGYGEANLGWGP